MLYIIGIIELPDGTALFILYYLCYYIYYGYNIFILKKTTQCQDHFVGPDVIESWLETALRTTNRTARLHFIERCPRGDGLHSHSKRGGFIY